MVEDIFQIIPSDWQRTNYYDKPFVLTPINNPYSQEYIELKARLQGNYFHVITGMYKIENPMTYARYWNTKQRYEQKGNTRVLSLYHDTALANCDSICHWNFDWRLGQRFKYGQGVYFSLYPDVAAKRSSPQNGIYRAMFVVDVLVQNVLRATRRDNIFLPTPEFDTVVASDSMTYVKYFESEFYPKYFATYEVAL